MAVAARSPPSSSVAGYGPSELAADLVATRDGPRRQQRALQALQAQVAQGVSPGALLQTVVDLASSSDAALRSAALQVLASFLARPALREGCSGLADLLSVLWDALPGADDAGARAILSGFAALGPEDIVQLLALVDAEALVRRAADHRLPAVRAVATRSLGEALVRAWPCVAAGHDEHMRDGCVEALRLVFGRLANEATRPEVQAASAAVLDALLAAYLSVDSPSLAAIALLHVSWPFAQVYGVLIVELTHDLLPVLDRLLGLPQFGPLVATGCVWLAEAGAGPSAAEAAEAAAFRASLLWLLLQGGGLAQRDDGCGSLAGDLLWEVAASRRPAAPRSAEVPQALLAALRGCEASGLPGLRARLALAVLDVARGAGPAALLDVAEALLERSYAPAVQRAAAEGLCSLLALVPAMGGEERFVQAAARSLHLGAAVVGQEEAPQGPTLPLMALLASAFVRSWAAAPRRDALLGAFDRGGVGAPPALLALLCCAVSGLPAEEVEAKTAASLELVQVACPRLFLEAARTSGGQRGNAAASAGCADAAVWRMLCLGRAAAAREPAAAAALLQGLGRPELLGTISAAALAASLADAGALAEAPAELRDRVAQALRRNTGELPPETARYVEVVAQATLVPQRPADGSALASPLGTRAASLQSALWLHSFAGEGRREEPRSISVSGPPLMVHLRLLPSGRGPGSQHLALRIDVFNVTGLIYRNVSVAVGLSAPAPLRGRAAVASLVGGANPPKACSSVEALGVRSVATFWRSLVVRDLGPASLTVTLSYENTPAPEVASAPSPSAGASTPARGSSAGATLQGDAWSDDEGEERLRFTCQPLQLPLSAFLRPFRGFDAPPGGALPPPAAYLALPHEREESVAEVALDLETWRPPGLRRLTRQGCGHTAPGALLCFAGLGLDDHSVLLLVCKGREMGCCLAIEGRSNSEALVTAFMDHLPVWLHASG